MYYPHAGLIYAPYLIINHLPTVLSVAGEYNPVLAMSSEELFEATCRANPGVDPEHIRRVPVDRPEQKRRYEEFHRVYNLAHAACPRCGGKNGITTLVSYALDLDESEAYRDRNHFTCSDCGDTHEVHDRVPVA